MIIRKYIFKILALGLFSLLFFCKNTIAQSAEFIIGSSSNVTTSTISIPVKANKFSQILAWQGSINWNNSKITFLSINSIVSQLNGIQFNTAVNSSTGMLSFFWVDNNLQPQSVLDSTVLFTITFNVVPNAAGTTDVSFSNNPTLLQLADINGNQISAVNYINGQVTFANEVLPPEFTIGSISNVSTSTITVPVTTKNFVQLLGSQGTITWDNLRLNFVNTSSIIPQLNGLQFNNSTNGNTGQLSFLWIDANLVPQTISDSSVLFTITFNVIGITTGITNINFSNTPTPLQTSDALGMPVNNSVYSNGIVSFPGATLPPIFILPTVSNVQTNSFSLPVTAKNFTQLKAIQGSINWDNRKYNYLNVSSSLPQFNGILFNASVTGDYGTLSYVWVDASSAPQSIPDDSILFTINFNRNCDAIGGNEISFTNSPTIQLVVNASDSVVSNAIYVNGRLSIPSAVTPAVYISTPSNILCSGISPVLYTNVSNGGSNTLFQWYKNNVLLSGANNPTYTSQVFNNNDSVKCIITSNVACATTGVATSNIIAFVQKIAIRDTVSISGCNGVTYNNILYNSNTTKNDTLRTIYGCDSIYRFVQISIVPLVPVSQIINLSGCNSLIYNGISYTSSITKQDTIRTLQGCDSLYNTVNIVIDKNILGNIKHPIKGDISNVTVKLSGSINNSILVSGNYSFNCLPTSTIGVIKPTKNNDITKSNGINATDVLFTQRHILNTTKLNSAYKLIAADVNGDKNINATDILRIKRLILGTDTTFTSATKGNRLWEFVDSAYIFPDTTNPFPFKDSISFTNLTSNKINQTFIGVKLGDVNYDWNPLVAKGSLIDNVELIIDNADIKVDKQLSTVNYQLPIKVKNFKDLVAMQYTLHFDHTKYEFVGIENNHLNIDFNSKQASENGNITMLWTDKNAVERTLEDGTELFVLVLQSTVDRRPSTDLELALTNDITEVAAWDKELNQHNIILTKQQKLQTPNPEQWSVSPNPTSGDIKVNIVSKVNKAVSFELTDAQGKTILKQVVELQKGNNNFTMNLKKNGNLTTGIYFLKAVGVVGDNIRRIMVK